MKTLLKRRIAAIFVAGILLFSNYGILAFADETVQPNENPTEQVSEEENQQENNDEQANDEQADDEQADDEQANDEQADDEQANDEQANDEQADDEQANDEQANDEQANYEELDDNQKEDFNNDSEQFENKEPNEEDFQPFGLDLDIEPMDAEDDLAVEPFEGEILTEEEPQIQEEIIMIYDQDNNISSGISIGGSVPTLFELKNKDEDHIVQLIKAYCNQLEVFISDGAEYKVELLENSESNDNLRGILLNGYPTKTLEELRLLPGLSNITEKQAIAATQMAIWNLNREDSQKFTTDNQNAKKLYDLLKTKKEQITSPSSSINVSTPEVELVENVVNVKYTYSISNTDQIKSRFIEDKFELDGFQVVSRITDENGITTVILSKIIENMEEEFSIEGNIDVNGNIGFYDIYNINFVKTNGINSSQGLVSLPFIKNYNLPSFKHLINFKYTPPVKPPVDEPPVDEPPVDEPPVDEPPVDEPPVEEPPVIIPPTEQPPTDVPPVVVPPVQNDDDEDVVVEEEETPLGLPNDPEVVVATVTSIEIPEEEIVEEIVPLAVPVVEVIQEPLPLGAPELPKTGGFAPELLYGIGLGLIALGYKAKK